LGAVVFRSVDIQRMWDDCETNKRPVSYPIKLFHFIEKKHEEITNEFREG
jgi:hypothetical protein